MIFETTLEVLISRGIDNALEICNEIEGRLMANPHRKLSGLELLECALDAVLSQYPDYTTSYRYQWGDDFISRKRIRDLAAPITVDAIKSPSRLLELVNARHIICWLIAKHSKMSLKDIGHLLGHRDHSTVINGRNKVNDLCSYDKEYSRKLAIIEKDFKIKIGKYN